MMRKTLPLICTALLALAGCSREADAPPPAAPTSTSTVPTQADVDKAMAEGIEPIARRLAVTDYYLHYHLMQATGITEALGGEEQAIAALKAIGEEYERRMQWARDETPKMIPASFTGEGMSAGMFGFSAGAVGGFMTATIMNAVLGKTLSEREWSETIEAMKRGGSMELGDENGSLSLQFGEDGSFGQTMEYKVEENGLKGKLNVKIHIDGCPDPQGKMTITFDIDSQMRVVGKEGTGGYVRAQLKKQAWLDDDAQLINTADGRESELHVEMGGFENYSGQHYEFTERIARGGNRSFDENTAKGFSIFRPSEIARLQSNISSVADSLNWVTEMMLRGIKDAPWESGRCVEVEVRTNPEKRTGADPGINYKITVIPRARSDGQVTTGTVRTTLSGDSSLDPADTKVKVEADAKFEYANPEEKDKTASIDFEARSKRGVGRATANFDTEEKHSYRIDGIGDCPGPWDVCDVTKPFTFAVCGGTMTHTPSGERGGSYTFKHSGVPGSGSYSLSGEEERLSATYQGQTCPPRMGCIRTPPGKATWTKIDGCQK